jgi:Response regulator receiver domain
MIYQEPQIRVVVADDHPVTRDGVVRALKSSGKIEVVASVADGRAALEAIRELRPAVALLDYKMPELDGACRSSCSSHTVGALSRRRRASRITSRHIGICRQTSSSRPSPLVPRCAVRSMVKPSRRTAVDSSRKTSTHNGMMSSEIHYHLQNPAPSAAAYS